MTHTATVVNFVTSPAMDIIHSSHHVHGPWGEPICIKICTSGQVPDVITCAKFQNEILRDCDSTTGRNFHFPVDFWMSITTVQRYCSVCDIAPLVKEPHSRSTLVWHALSRDFITLSALQLVYPQWPYRVFLHRSLWQAEGGMFVHGGPSLGNHVANSNLPVGWRTVVWVGLLKQENWMFRFTVIDRQTLQNRRYYYYYYYYNRHYSFSLILVSKRIHSSFHFSVFEAKQTLKY